MNTTAQPVELPKKSLFKMNEVCGIAGVKPYVLRFWENEFDEISPVKSSLGQKLYNAKDVEFISKLKKLLFEEKMTIEKIKAHIRSPETAKSLSTGQARARPEKAAKVPSVSAQKLLMAKTLLEEMLVLTETTKRRRGWA